MKFKYEKLKKLGANHLPKMSEKEFEIVKNEWLHIKDVDKFFSDWFLGAKPTDIKRSQVLDWLAASFYNQKWNHLDSKLEMVNELLVLLEAKMKTKWASEDQMTNGHSITLTLDPMLIYHRPLIFYLVVRLIDAICRFILINLGFRKIKADGGTFYVRALQENDSKIVPFVFFHGLGIGLTTYIPFLLGLIIHYPDRPVILFEMPSISTRLDDNHVLPLEYATHVIKCLDSMNMTKAVFGGHSLGTAVVRWIDLFYPERVKGRVLIDPICFVLWTHTIAHNALYRKPNTFHESFIKLVGMSEIGIAVYLHRYFVWFQNTYWTESLPENCVIYVSEMDDIVNAFEVCKYLSDNSHPTRKVVLLSWFHHGQICASPEVGRLIRDMDELFE